MSEEPDGRGGGDDDGRADGRHPDRDGADADGGERGDDEPLSELADRIRRSRSRREGERRAAGAEGDPFAALEREVDGGGSSTPSPPADGPDDDPFDRVAVDAIDEETVWESLAAEEGTTIDPATAGVGGEAERVEREDPGASRPDHVVEKDAYCRGCRFLSAPPEVRCDHEGSEIVEVVDSERFRVRGCPVVAQRGALDRDTDDA